MDKRTFSGGTAAAFLTVPLFLLPAEIIPRFGEWLRELSLSGAAGNILAWAIVLALSALPALGLLWRPRCQWDWLLPLAAAETFAGLYLLVNPSLVSNVPGIDGGKFIALAAVGSVSSTLLAWAVLRSLKHIERSVQEIPQVLDKGTADLKIPADLGIDDQVHVPLAVAQLGVGQAVEFFWKDLQAFG